jgi:redox-sensitive bicupin YhaK (pirin superfamily)
MIEKILEARPRDVAGFRVGRVLPAHGKALVGPFIFFDHMGPNVLAPGHGMDVPPHPHIGLETVTYLFEGEAHHRDSTGASQLIVPGDINWMTAGRGVVHSERTPPAARTRGGAMHGLQLWVALPKEHEETAPTFQHHPASTLPTVHQEKCRLRVMAGSAYGVTSPVKVFSTLFYVEAFLVEGALLSLPDFEERAAYVIEGSIRCGETTINPRQMAIFTKGSAPIVSAEQNARVVLLGGAPIAEPRFIWWNFVSSTQERIERAKREWAERRFPVVPGDEIEFVPLPIPKPA